MSIFSNNETTTLHYVGGKLSSQLAIERWDNQRDIIITIYEIFHAADGNWRPLRPVFRK